MPEAPSVMFIHGWGADKRVFNALISELGSSVPVAYIELPGFGENTAAQPDWQRLCVEIADALPSSSILVGWSLGAMLIPEVVLQAQAQGKKVESIVSIAANAFFVADAECSQAMNRADYNHFLVRFESRPAQTLKRFIALQSMGDNNARTVTCALDALLPAFLTVDNVQNSREFKSWLQGLRWLSQIDNRERLKRLTQPVCHILGEHDALVPSACKDFLASCGANHRVLLLKGVSHAPHLSQPKHVANIISDVIHAAGLNSDTLDAYHPTEQLDKTRVAESFSHAAERYDSVAVFQKKMAQKLCSFNFGDATLRPSKALQGKTVVDLGCGTGYCVDALATHASAMLSFYHLDIALNMLKTARNKADDSHCERLFPFQGVCADIESLPFKRDSVDMFVSNMSIQWCERLPRLFEQVHQALKSSGIFVFSTLGPQSLYELKQAWASADRQAGLKSQRHVNAFYSFDSVELAAADAGFHIQLCEHSKEQVNYESARTLLKELKTIGAHNMNKDQPRGLTGKTRFKLMLAAYEQFRTPENTLPLTYDMGFYVLTKTPSKRN